MPNNFIVITSINSPTEALKKFSLMPDWQVILVADLKTPKDWQLDNVKVLSVEEQKTLPFTILKYLPWNHYARKNIGYLYAMLQGAELIYETDDDNIPYDSWHGFHPVQLQAKAYTSSTKFFNTYSYFCEANIWPRGFPLTAIHSPTELQIANEFISAPVQQGLADLDPDVDAIYRLAIGKEVKFSQREPVFLAPGTYCPFNSQNTLWYPEAFQYMYLPAFVFNRLTDIWRGYIAQHFLHQKAQGVLFCNASVYQERNYHKLLHDFIEEIDLYTRTEELINVLNEYTSHSQDFAGIMQHLHQHHFVKDEEVVLFDSWLEDLRSLKLV